MEVGRPPNCRSIISDTLETLPPFSMLRYMAGMRKLSHSSPLDIPQSLLPFRVYMYEKIRVMLRTRYYCILRTACLFYHFYACHTIRVRWYIPTLRQVLSICQSSFSMIAYYGAPFIPKLDVQKCTLGLLFGKLTQMAHLISVN